MSDKLPRLPEQPEAHGRWQCRSADQAQLQSSRPVLSDHARDYLDLQPIGDPSLSRDGRRVECVRAGGGLVMYVSTAGFN